MCSLSAISQADQPVHPVTCSVSLLPSAFILQNVHLQKNSCRRRTLRGKPQIHYTPVRNRTYFWCDRTNASDTSEHMTRPYRLVLPRTYFCAPPHHVSTGQHDPASQTRRPPAAPP